MDMTPQRWANTSAYLRDVFGRQDQHLAGLMDRAVAAGLPAIAVSPDVGHLLTLLASLTNAGRGARLVLELGTLAGYSGIWLARGLADGGKLITVEYEPKHAAFARSEFQRAGLADRVDLRTGAALEVIPRLAEELQAGKLAAPVFDLVFFDAIKTEYTDYYRLCKPLLAPGGLLIADNVLGSSFWIDDPPGSSPQRDAIDSFNRTVAADPDFITAAVPLREGVMIARKIR